MYTGIVTILLDAWIVTSEKGAFTSEAVGHAVFAPVGAVTGWLLLQ